MKHSLLYLFSLMLMAACSSDSAYPFNETVGKRVFAAKGNISFVLPDSALVYSKLSRWGPCCSSCDYGETNDLYHNADSSVMVTVYVKAYPDRLQRTLPWRAIADEKRRRYELSAKSMGMAVIEHYATDSIARTIDIEYTLPKRPELGRRGQASYERDLTFYGPQRTVRFWFFGPDKTAIRLAFAKANASVRVDPAYLQEAIKPYSESQYLD